jgi:hypothetical protein
VEPPAPELARQRGSPELVREPVWPEVAAAEPPVPGPAIPGPAIPGPAIHAALDSARPQAGATDPLALDSAESEPGASEPGGSEPTAPDPAALAPGGPVQAATARDGREQRRRLQNQPEPTHPAQTRGAPNQRARIPAWPARWPARLLDAGLPANDGRRRPGPSPPRRAQRRRRRDAGLAQHRHPAPVLAGRAEPQSTARRRPARPGADAPDSGTGSSRSPHRRRRRAPDGRRDPAVPAPAGEGPAQAAAAPDDPCRADAAAAHAGRRPTVPRNPALPRQGPRSLASAPRDRGNPPPPPTGPPTRAWGRGRVTRRAPAIRRIPPTRQTPASDRVRPSARCRLRDRAHRAPAGPAAIHCS